MEKLQKALSKARQARSGLDQVASKPRAEQRKIDVAQPATRPIWHRLSPFEPDPGRLLRNRVMTLYPQDGSNSFDILRTKTFLRMKENGWTRLAITSPDRDCGKTTVVCNLALSFARQKEVSSILMDLDLRVPAVAPMLGVSPEHDIVKLLDGTVSPEEQMQRIGTNLALALGVNTVHDPLQLLLSQGTAQRFDELESLFKPDVMLFDLPPMLSTDDSRAMLKNVDCAMIVARAEHTHVRQLDVCEREVSELTNVLGVVLNNCATQNSGDESYAGYG